jgi:hypothetical protein
MDGCPSDSIWDYTETSRQFTVADVMHPLIGDEFLSHFGLSVDYWYNHLLDGATLLSPPIHVASKLTPPVSRSAVVVHLSTADPVEPAHHQVNQWLSQPIYWTKPIAETQLSTQLPVQLQTQFHRPHRRHCHQLCGPHTPAITSTFPHASNPMQSPPWKGETSTWITFCRQPLLYSKCSISLHGNAIPTAGELSQKAFPFGLPRGNIRRTQPERECVCIMRVQARAHTHMHTHLDLKVTSDQRLFSTVKT